MAELSRVNYRKINKDYFDKESVHGKLRMVALDADGAVKGIHDAVDYNKWVDGTNVDWAAYEANGWNCMVQIPKFYYKVEEGSYKDFNEVTRLSISESFEDGYKLHPAFNREEGEENYQYIGAFQSSLVGSIYRSLPSKGPASFSMSQINSSYNINSSKDGGRFKELYDKVKANGYNYSLVDPLHISMIQMLVLTELGEVDIHRTDSVVQRGDRSFVLTTGTSPMKGSNDLFPYYYKEGNNAYYGFHYRGMEALLGPIGILSGGIGAVDARTNILAISRSIVQPALREKVFTDYNTTTSTHDVAPFCYTFTTNEERKLKFHPETSLFLIGLKTRAEYSANALSNFADSIPSAGTNFVNASVSQFNTNGLFCWGSYYGNNAPPQITKLTCYPSYYANPRLSHTRG